MTLGIDFERDARITKLAARTSAHCDAAVAFVLRLVFMVLLVAGGVWALLTWLEPCSPAGSLCSIVPLLRGRPRYSSTSPAALEIPRTPPGLLRRQWLRWRLWLVELRLMANANDTAMLREGIDLDGRLIDELIARRGELRDEAIDIELELSTRG
jgi:hypothetical protein